VIPQNSFIVVAKVPAECVAVLRTLLATMNLKRVREHGLYDGLMALRPSFIQVADVGSPRLPQERRGN
jgi:hypothetical protein